jgi:hypothetical protein
VSVWAGFGPTANDRYNDSVADLRASGASVQTMLESTYTNADRDDRLLRFFALQTMGEVGEASALAFLDAAARDPNDLDPPPIPPELVNEDIAAPWSEEYVLRITAVHSICDIFRFSGNGQPELEALAVDTEVVDGAQKTAVSCLRHMNVSLSGLTFAAEDEHLRTMPIAYGTLIPDETIYDD